MTNDRKQDIEWIARAKKDRAQFAPLYNKYFNAVFRFVYSRVSDKELTGDLTSQTFIKAMMALERYEDRGYAFSSWLFRIAINEVNMHFRAAKKDQWVQVDEELVAGVLAETENDEVKNSPEELVEALNLLDEEKTNLIELRFFEKRSFAEIGEILGVPSDTAKMRVYRAIQKLKEIMSQPK